MKNIDNHFELVYDSSVPGWYEAIDLIKDIDQAKTYWIGGENGSNAYGEDGLDHHSIFVDAGYVGEAVRRINEAGYATDEDEDEDGDEDDMPYEGMFDEVSAGD